MAQRQVMPIGHVIPELADLIGDAMKSQNVADRKWVTVANTAAKIGFKSTDITGKDRDLQKVADMRVTVISRFPKPVQTLLGLASHEVADLDDKTKGVRFMWQQRIGAYVSHIAKHLRKLEPTKLRAPKEKSDAGSTGGPDFKNDKSAMHGWSRQLNALKAGALIVRNDKDQTMTAADATELQNALTVALAIIGKYTG